MEFKRITDRILYTPGDSERYWPSSTVVLGDEKTLLIDGGATPEHSSLIKEALEKLGRKADYLVLSHWHWDHSFGLSQWKKAESVAQEKTVLLLEEQAGYEWNDDALYWRMEQGVESEFMARMIKKEYSDLSKINIAVPKRYYVSEELIDLGGISCELHHVPSDHALDNTVIYVPEEKFLFLGDCLNENIYSESWHYTHGRLAVLINKLREFEADLVLESHSNEPLGRIPFIDLLWQLQTINDTVFNAVEEGKVDDIENLLSRAFDRPLVESDRELMTACLYGYYQ
jgi:glyoxylase-like metal-dependent hydrolase (beta-lactamase superfamily II)